jgi:ABC-type antimicrobial peptide transport system permease subunit
VALALIGIYGVVSHLVSQRTVEIGIRMAMGAQNREVLSLILRRGVVMIIAGLALGTVGALALTRLVGRLRIDSRTNGRRPDESTSANVRAQAEEKRCGFSDVRQFGSALKKSVD